MVDPGHRRRGIARALLGGALAAAAHRHIETVLVIFEDRSPVALDWMRRRAATLDQSELRMVLRLDNAPAGRAGSTPELKPATTADRAELLRLLSDGFPQSEAFIQKRLAEQPADEETLMAYDGRRWSGRPAWSPLPGAR